ncbi:MAG: M56 family metallopeptidase [Pleurocapsa sp.]
MHLLTILTVVLLAWSIRHQPLSFSQKWSERWYRALFLFLLPSLLLLTTAIAVLYMGCHGEMLGVKAGSVGCLISASLILFSGCCLLKLATRGDRSIRQLAIYQQQTVGGTTAKILDTDLPYSAQIGFWQSKLVVSKGLLTALDEEHLAAVIAHEQAHLHYRDTFWFFWLGWIRSFTFWLPNTERLWQELLLLRELRADRKAAESVDFLLLAESLLIVAKAPLESSLVCHANLIHSTIGDRLNERIDFLLAETEFASVNRWHSWSWVWLLFLPLLTIPLHG